MGFMTLFLIACGLAADAFSVALTDGMILKKPKAYQALKIAGFFGIFQFGMLYIGFVLAGFFADKISSVDHWIAFFLLLFIGSKMIIDAVFKNDEDDITDPLGNKTLFLLAVATSIDALAVGVSFAAMDIRILFPAIVVGAVAFSFSFAGVFIGDRSGSFLGDRSEIAGGIILILIGAKILIEHLFF